MRVKTDKHTRALLFWSVCIPLRTLITIHADTQQWLRIPAAVMAHTWLSGHASSLEGVFGGFAWWANQRHAHGLLWGAYAATGMWEFLALDTAGGAANWLRNS